MKMLYFAVFSAVAAAVLISSLWKPVPIEERLIQLQVEQLLPEYADALLREPIALQAQFIDYARDSNPALAAKAWLALLRYPEMTRPILALYGAEPEFQKVLQEYGDQIIPPIHYFLNHEIRSVAVRKQMHEWLDSGLAGVRRLWGDQKAASVPSSGAQKGEVTAQERGWYAVMSIKQEGHDFLGQFVLGKDGQVNWVQTERVLEGVNAFFAGGVRGLETKYRRDESIAPSDMGWAALDIAVGVSALKVLRMGRAAAVTTRTMRYSQRTVALGSSLLRGSAIGLRLAKYGAPVALAYIAVRHPSVLNSIFGGLADTLGLPVFMMQTLGWTLALLPILLVLQFLLRPLALLLMGFGKGLRWFDTRMRGRIRSVKQ
ncbi:MAG: hypothetical protein ACOH2B_14300 [Burkholderiaceae bacterium]